MEKHVEVSKLKIIKHNALIGINKPLKLVRGYKTIALTLLILYYGYELYTHGKISLDTFYLAIVFCGLFALLKETLDR